MALVVVQVVPRKILAQWRWCCGTTSTRFVIRYEWYQVCYTVRVVPSLLYSTSGTRFVIREWYQVCYTVRVVRYQVCYTVQVVPGLLYGTSGIVLQGTSGTRYFTRYKWYQNCYTVQVVPGEENGASDAGRNKLWRKERW